MSTKQIRPSSNLPFTAPQTTVSIRHTRKEMPFNHRFSGILCLSAISTLVLKSAQDSATPTNNSSLIETPGTLSLNLSTITNQSEQNDASIDCETGQWSRFGRPRPLSCADALNHIPSDTDLLFFGNRGTAPRGAKGLPYRYTSCKP